MSPSRRSIALRLAAVTVAGVTSGRVARALLAPPYDWHFVYVMPYDNDLDRCTAPITEALQRAAEHPRVAVTVLSDGVARDGLRVRLITHDARRERRIRSEDSADPAQVSALLDGAVSEARARRYVVVFLDHGGMLDQMGYDERLGFDASANTTPRWLSARAVGDVLRAWMRRHRLDARAVPLVFLQQCGRASIEALSNLRATSEAVLASQREVGTCNTYYASLLDYAAAHPDASPRELSRVVARADLNYRSYTLVRTAALDRWTPLARALSDALLDGPSPPDGGALSSLRPCFSAGMEQNYDLLQVTGALASGRGPAVTRAASDMDRWVRSELVMEHLRRGDDRASAGWCGVSTMVPALQGWFAFYPRQVAYRDTRWSEVLSAAAPTLGITVRAPPRSP